MAEKLVIKALDLLLNGNIVIMRDEFKTSAEFENLYIEADKLKNTGHYVKDNKIFKHGEKWNRRVR